MRVGMVPVVLVLVPVVLRLGFFGAQEGSDCVGPFGSSRRCSAFSGGAGYLVLLAGIWVAYKPFPKEKKWTVSGQNARFPHA